MRFHHEFFALVFGIVLTGVGVVLGIAYGFELIATFIIFSGVIALTMVSYSRQVS